MQQPYVTFPWEAIRALVAELCPDGDLDKLLPILEADQARIRALPIDDPSRQLLAALRLRATCLPSEWYGSPSRINNLHYWLGLQRCCPLSA